MQRDYYGIYILSKLQAENIDIGNLIAALSATTAKRGSSELMQYVKIMKTVKNSDVMKRQWDNYRKNFDYAAGIEFEETCDAVVAMMDELVSRQ
jgi:hypothetical protein